MLKTVSKTKQNFLTNVHQDKSSISQKRAHIFDYLSKHFITNLKYTFNMLNNKHIIFVTCSFNFFVFAQQIIPCLSFHTTSKNKPVPAYNIHKPSPRHIKFHHDIIMAPLIPVPTCSCFGYPKSMSPVFKRFR